MIALVAVTDAAAPPLPAPLRVVRAGALSALCLPATPEPVTLDLLERRLYGVQGGLGRAFGRPTITYSPCRSAASSSESGGIVCGMRTAVKPCSAISSKSRSMVS